MAGGWIDITVPLRDGMVHWPDNPPVWTDGCWICSAATIARSRPSRSASTRAPTWTPAHFLPDGRGMDAMPASATIGPARVIVIRDPESIKPEELRAHRIRRGERLLFKTRNSPRCWTDFVYLDEAAAR